MSLSFPYTFSINGTSFSGKVQRYGYKTSYMPVYSEVVTTLDKVDHSVIIRWRHGLEVILNPMSEADLKALQTALAGSSVASVTFSSLQLESDVTCNMVLAPSSAALVLKNASRRVVGDFSLKFTEL